MIGKAIAHLQIEARLGAGGMGEVYQARDLRLERTSPARRNHARRSNRSSSPVADRQVKCYSGSERRSEK
jgi:hypothetical protein